MAGELYRSVSQWGLESVPGTPVAATRKMYLREPVLSIERTAAPYRVATGTRDNVRGMTSGPTMAGGSVSQVMSADECLELLNIGVSGSPVITTPGGATVTRLHTYKPGPLASATIEWDDGARVWQGAGYRANSLTISGAVGEENTIAAELFGQDVIAGTLTGALAERTPSFLQGWQTKVYIEAFSGTPGTTVISGFLRNWNVTLNNNLGRVYTADNTLAANRVIDGELDVTASLTIDANSAQALTEFNNWAAGTQRMIRLEFIDTTGFIEGALRRFVTVDIPGAWTAQNIGGSADGIRTYELSLQSIYQATLAAMVQVRAQCARTAAFV
jgi:hypothetical protein